MIATDKLVKDWFKIRKIIRIKQKRNPKLTELFVMYPKPLLVRNGWPNKELKDWITKDTHKTLKIRAAWKYSFPKRKTISKSEKIKIKSEIIEENIKTRIIALLNLVTLSEIRCAKIESIIGALIDCKAVYILSDKEKNTKFIGFNIPKRIGGI